jgi:ABC-type bacteriocin/lantibiotic exporter with double-glycine peptidase domain
MQTFDDLPPVILNINHKGFDSTINIENLNYRYPDSHALALREISLNIQTGSHVAIVGDSGAGKTTLVDAILGVIETNPKEVLISGFSPHEAVQKWPGAIAYVPQDITIIEGTIRDNLILGYDKSEVSDALIAYALNLASLSEFTQNQPQGIDTQVGDFGSNLSGGQRQRIGIARALITQPKLLILDEATSALDAQTENEISSAILNMKGTVTVVSIAHRLSTVQHADLVIYLSEGRILGAGSFEEVRSIVPNFDRNAKLLGL